MSNPSRIYAVIPCAGTGSRAGTAQPKQYQPLAGQAMLWHTLAAFVACERVQQTVLVVSAQDSVFAQHTPPSSLDASRWLAAPVGGASRADSVLGGLRYLLENGAAPTDWVMVHDAARCLITPELITRLADACTQTDQGGLLALPLPDTLKAADAAQPYPHAISTVSRSDKWIAQTPQMFLLAALAQALEQGLAQDPESITDEASAIERTGTSPLLVKSVSWNFKVTYPDDFMLAEAVLQARQSK